MLITVGSTNSTDQIADSYIRMQRLSHAEQLGNNKRKICDQELHVVQAIKLEGFERKEAPPPVVQQAEKGPASQGGLHPGDLLMMGSLQNSGIAPSLLYQLFL